jgi:predicted HTH domain antitoxin
MREEFSTMATIKVTVEVPDEVGEHSREIAQARAQEAVVLALWQQQELTVREAADELGLSYREFLDLLTERGIPIEREPTDGLALKKARQKLANDQP